MPEAWPWNENLLEFEGGVYDWVDFTGRDPAAPDLAIMNPPPPREDYFDRLELLVRGQKIVRWLEDPNEPNCRIPQCSLTVDDMREHCIFSEEQNELLPSEIYDRRNAFPQYRAGAELESWYTRFEVNYPDVRWAGWTGPETLVMENIWRSDKGSWCREPTPYVSEISVALYERDHDLDTLRHVFVTNVLNDSTLQLLFELENELTEWSAQQVWQFHTEPYHEIIGSRLGKVVAYTLLGAFPRGAFRIQQIVSWMDEELVMLRFDVEPIPEAERVQFDQAESDRIRAEQVEDEEMADHLPNDPMRVGDMDYFMTR